MKSKAIRLKFIVCLVFINCACSNSGAEIGVTDEKIVLGAHSQQTGALSLYGVMNRTIRAYFEKVNRESGVHGRKIEYHIEDSSNSPQTALRVTKKLVRRKKIFAAIGNMGPPHRAVYRYLRKKKVPDLLFIEATSVYTSPPDFNSIAWSPTFAQEAKVYAQIIKNKFPGKKVGLVLPDTLEGKEALSAFKKEFYDQSLIAGVEEIKWGASNGDSQLLRLKKLGAEIVYLISTSPVSASMMKFAKEQKMNMQWFLGYWSCNKYTLDLAGNAAENAISFYYTYFDTDTEKAPVKKFLKFMKEELPNEPVSSNALGAFGIAETIVEALNRAGKDLTRKKLVEALVSLKGWKCSVCRSPSTISKDNRIFNGNIQPLIAKQGRWVVVETTE